MCLKFTTVLLSAKMGILRTTFVTESVEELLRSCRGAGEELERSWSGALEELGRNCRGANDYRISVHRVNHKKIATKSLLDGSVKFTFERMSPIEYLIV